MSVLVLSDFSENSLSSLHLASDVAKRSESELVVMHVVDIATGDNSWRILVEAPDEIERSSIAQARSDLETLFQQTISADHRPKRVRFVVELGNPIDKIMAQANALEPSLVVAGRHGASGIKELFLGSTANRLVRQCKFPVALVPSTQKTFEIKTIVAPVDFSQASLDSLRYAAELARERGALLQIMHSFVIPELTGLQSSSRIAAAQIQQLSAGKRQQIREYSSSVDLGDIEHAITIVQDVPHRAIIDFSRREGADLICMGSHGRRGWARFFLGNTAERVLHGAPCTVVTVRHEGKA